MFVTVATTYAHIVCIECVCTYVCERTVWKYAIYDVWLHYSSAFSQPATGPSSVCEGSDVTLQCRVVFNDQPRNSVWYRNGTLVGVGVNGFTPNYNQTYNSTTGIFTDLVITNVTLENDNSVYTCSSNDGGITSSVVLNVSGKYI